MDVFVWQFGSGHTRAGSVRGDTVNVLMERASALASSKGLSGALCLVKEGVAPPAIPDGPVTIPSQDVWRGYRKQKPGYKGGIVI